MIRTRFAVAALLLTVAAAAAAQSTTKVAVAPESKLWIDGTSNLHGWSCKTDALDASVEIDPALAGEFSVAPPKALKRVDVKVPVRSLKCGHDAMDNNLYKALDADKAPNVSYIMASFEAAPGDTKDTFTLRTVGTLSVAGKENKLAMDVVATRLPDGSVKAVGVVPIKMTDFGVKPPTAMFGTLRTGDEVKVNFELTIGAQAIATAVASASK